MNALTGEALQALALAEPVPSAGAHELQSALDHVQRGGVLDADVLVAVQKTITAAGELRAYLAPRRERFDRLVSALDTDPSLAPLGKDLARCIDESGEVLDAASPALRENRRREASVRGELSQRIRRLAKKHSDILREGGPVERDGRYALAVRADTHKRLDGIVLGASATGATLYVEPPEITALTNRLTLARAEVEREVLRVLAELSDRVREHVDALAQAELACIQADVLAALSDWAARTRSRVLEITDEPVIDLVNMRHPLLLDQNVVANDIRLESGNALIVSGPNAGGKTVALKCVGLAVWMARAGLPVPTGEGSRVTWYSRVLTDIGDDQSLERSLSTFSAEVVALREILAIADRQTLIVLDEIAGGTDPEEGAALASAVLERFVGLGATCLVTTHYERLKELAADRDRFVNASVGFDFDKMEPTFVLSLGQPGASSALAVAQRFGLSLEVLTRARELLSEDAVRREELIADLERQRRRLSESREAAERAEAGAQELLREAESERVVAREKERRRLERETADLIAKVKKARVEIRDIKQQSSKKAERIVDDAARLVAADSELAKRTRDPARTPPKAAAPMPIQVGAHVFVERLGTTAEVIEAPARGHVRVQAGAFGLRVPLREIRVDPRKSPRKKPQPVKRSAQPRPKAAALRTTDNTCDLRGLRVDEALSRLDSFIDSCLRVAEPVAFALHGHGTGALRTAVREHLALHAFIASSRPAQSGEGGDAFTVFWLHD